MSDINCCYTVIVVFILIPSKSNTFVPFKELKPCTKLIMSYFRSDGLVQNVYHVLFKFLAWCTVLREMPLIISSWKFKTHHGSWRLSSTSVFAVSYWNKTGMDWSLHSVPIIKSESSNSVDGRKKLRLSNKCKSINPAFLVLIDWVKFTYCSRNRKKCF